MQFMKLKYEFGKYNDAPVYNIIKPNWLSMN